MAFNKEMNARIVRDSVLCRKIVNMDTGEQFLNHTKPSDWVVGSNGLIARIAREWKTLYEHAVKNPEQLERIFGSKTDPDSGDPGPVSKADLEGMSYKALRETAIEYGIATDGKKKSELIPLILEASANQAFEKV